MEVIIATHNLHKLREIRKMLKELKHIDFTSFHDYPSYIPLEEVGQSFEENALLKAMQVTETLGAWAISDDSGLVVPALKGAPGVYSARYAGKAPSDLENRKKLLEDMQGFDGMSRSAYFECSLAITGPEGLKKTFKGICQGYISTEERGKNGFGYDPIFIKNDYSQTFAELSESIKNRISHRRKAMDKALLFFEQMTQH